MLPQFNGGTPLDVKTVWYTGSDTLREGYALCYDQDATVDDTVIGERLGHAVEKPATANLAWFAGIVHESSDGKVGPCFVNIIVPRRGDIVKKVYTKANATVSATGLGPADGSYALAAATFSATTTAAEVATCVMLAGETADTSTTAANKIAKFV